MSFDPFALLGAPPVYVIFLVLLDDCSGGWTAEEELVLRRQQTVNSQQIAGLSKVEVQEPLELGGEYC